MGALGLSSCKWISSSKSSSSINRRLLALGLFVGDTSSSSTMLFYNFTLVNLIYPMPVPVIELKLN